MVSARAWLRNSTALLAAAGSVRRLLISNSAFIPGNDVFLPGEGGRNVTVHIIAECTAGVYGAPRVLTDGTASSGGGINVRACEGVSLFDGLWIAQGERGRDALS